MVLGRGRCGLFGTGGGGGVLLLGLVRLLLLLGRRRAAGGYGELGGELRELVAVGQRLEHGVLPLQHRVSLVQLLDLFL